MPLCPRGRYKGCKPALTGERLTALRQRVASGGNKTALARELGVSRQTVYAVISDDGYTNAPYVLTVAKGL